MVDSTDSLNNDSNNRAGQVSTPIGNSSKNPVDCGLSIFPCLNRWINLERFAKIIFLYYVLMHITVIQGVFSAYFEETSTIWKQQYGIPDNTFECLLSLDKFLAGILALTITYWANRIHKATWTGGLACCQALVAILLTVSETYNSFQGEIFPNDDDNLCQMSNNATTTLNDTAGAFNKTAIGVLFLYQTFSALGRIVLYCLAVSYVDDNVVMERSPIFVAILLASNEIGKQIGINLSSTVVSEKSTAIFSAPMFCVFSVGLFIFGTFMTMFPKRLPSMLPKKSILDTANGIDEAEEKDAVDGYFETMGRMFRNKILITNVIVSTLTFSAVFNYELMRPIFYQSYFYLPSKNFDLSGYNHPRPSQLTNKLIKQTFMALSILLAAFIVSKFKPRPKSIALWSRDALGSAITVIAILAFNNCDKSLQTDFDNSITTPSYSRCICSEDILFSPVCTELDQITYFSACHAGCTSVEEVNGVKIFQNCGYGDNTQAPVNTKATLGSCNKNCQTFWGSSEANDIIAAGFVASTLVTSFLISMRCVKSTDKCVALGFHITFLGIIPYIPFRIIYVVIADLFCQYRTSNGDCRFHSQGIGIFLSVITIVLLLITALLSTPLSRFVKELDFYGEIKDDKKNNTNDDELKELDSRNDNHSRDNYSNLKDLGSESSSIPEDATEESANRNDNLQLNEKLTSEPEHLNSSLTEEQ